MITELNRRLIGQGISKFRELLAKILLFSQYFYPYG